MIASLLPQQPAPATRRDRRLTARYLDPARPALMALFQALRAETDAAIGTASPAPYGKPYPLGCCREITVDVMDRLRARLSRSGDDPGTAALRAFLAAGGTCRCVWGVLRERYFQTAMQLGALYVDVANDTVTVTKPKVEMLPMAESGLAAIEGPAHFARIAKSYWNMTVVANHALPSLAPVMPMIGIRAGGAVGLQSPTDYMMALFQRDGFAEAEAWLGDGPAPQAEAMARLRAACPPALIAANPATGAAAAVAACRAARADSAAATPAWLDARLAEFRAIAALRPPHRADAAAVAPRRKVVLAVGGGALHPAFGGADWRAVACGGGGAGDLAAVPAGVADAVWSPIRPEGLHTGGLHADTLAAYRRVLRPDGLALISRRAGAVPDSRAVAEAFVAAGFIRVIAQRDGDAIWAVAYCREQPPEVIAGTGRLRERLPSARTAA
ncbi:MAG: hypothetical protein AB7K86_17490 [Rhodospirillales bacterium]